MLVEMLADDPQVAGVRSKEEIRHGAHERDDTQRPIDPDIAEHPRHLQLRHAKVARFPHQPRTDQCGNCRAHDRHQVQQHVQAHLAAGTGYGEQPLHHPLHRFQPQANRCRVTADRQILKQGASVHGARTGGAWACVHAI
jgi:hypothetical protein